MQHYVNMEQVRSAPFVVVLNNTLIILCLKK